MQLFLFFLLGLVVGSFLNVLALRTLANKPILWSPYQCPKCEHRLAFYENIPVLSYLFLAGKCRYCHAAISAQYLAVELITGVLFVFLFKMFGISWQLLGMLVFVSTLIVASVTDFLEKLIPHDITYPSMLLGILFSALIRKDLLGAMAGIGASYILFDFLAHYGLKFYLSLHSNKISPEADRVLDKQMKFSDDDPSIENIEVMGGGDAVLAAVISAWLGWQRLVLALVVGFLAGTVMGTVYLVREMKKEKILHESIKPVILGATSGFVLIGVFIMLTKLFVGDVVFQIPWIAFASFAAVGGALIGLISVGTKVSKPFPFGPALSLGALVAVFTSRV